MKNQKGFTLLEILVATGLMAMVFSVASYQAYQMNLMQKQLSTTAENLTTTTFAENYLWDRLRNAGIGFNVSVELDDQNNNFYDYISDVPENLVPSAARSRRLSISNDPGKKSQFFIVTYDFSKSATAIFEPSTAYALSETSPITASNFTYSGINANGILKSRMGAGWAPGKHFLLINPVPLRAIGANGMVDMSKPGKPMVFLGQVTNDEKDLNFSNLAFVRREDPRDPANIISSADKFFRYLPLAGGSAPLVEIVPVKLVRFWLEPNPTKPGTSSLFAGEFESGVTKGRFILADDVKMVVLSRSTVTSRLITAQICSREKVHQCLKP